jgi:hypothetical protein
VSGQRQVHAGQRRPATASWPASSTGARKVAAARHTRDRRARARRQGDRRRPVARSAARRGPTRPPTPACSTTSASCSPPAAEAKVRGYQPGRFSLQRQGRPLRGLQRRRHRSRSR